MQRNKSGSQTDIEKSHTDMICVDFTITCANTQNKYRKGLLWSILSHILPTSYQPGELITVSLEYYGWRVVRGSGMTDEIETELEVIAGRNYWNCIGNGGNGRRQKCKNSANISDAWKNPYLNKPCIILQLNILDQIMYNTYFIIGKHNIYSMSKCQLSSSYTTILW